MKLVLTLTALLFSTTSFAYEAKQCFGCFFPAPDTLVRVTEDTYDTEKEAKKDCPSDSYVYEFNCATGEVFTE